MTSAVDQWLRVAQSIPLNIAEGNGKRCLKDRARFLDIAHGSALECAAIEEVLLTTNGINAQDDAAMKAMLCRIVAMLSWKRQELFEKFIVQCQLKRRVPSPGICLQWQRRQAYTSESRWTKRNASTR